MSKRLVTKYEYVINHEDWKVRRWRAWFFKMHEYDSSYYTALKQEETLYPCIYIPYGNPDIIGNFKKAHEYNAPPAPLPEITEDTNVFIASNCNIARNRFKKKFNIVSDIKQAEVIIVSDNFASNDICEDRCIVFADDDNKMFFLCKYVTWTWRDYLNKDYDYIPNVGDSFDDFVRRNSSRFEEITYDKIPEYLKEWWKKIRCIYDGSIWTCRDNEYDIIKAASNNGATIVSQSDVASLLAVDDSVITVDQFKSISSSLNSPDNDNVLYGLKTLANLNYMNFPSTTSWLLKKYAWQIKRLGNLPKEVSYMMTTAQQRRSTSFPFMRTNEKELELAQYILGNEIRERLDDIVKGFKSDTNLTVTIDYTVDISAPSGNKKYAE